MKSIVYIVPYFGKEPTGFKYWLKSCELNKTISWLFLTDINFDYELPKNFIVIKTTFEEIKNKIQSAYDFDIFLDRPWKLCDFRPAYGEIFKDYIKDFDFWGHCDVDLVFGDIRKFITDEILEKYDRVGYQGHSTLYRNNNYVNARYKCVIEGLIDYKTAFTNGQGFCFDEDGIGNIYNALNIPYYHQVNFAHLRKFDTKFFLGHKSADEDYKNFRQVFVWENGTLTRYYLEKDKKTISSEEYMYIHFWCRPMSYRKINENDNYFFIYSDVVSSKRKDINVKTLKKYGKEHPIMFYVKALIKNRKKLTLKRIIWNLKNRKKESNNR